jgi:AraC-like DNA-binding protein
VRWFGLTFGGSSLEPPAPPGWQRLVATRSGACLARAAGLLATVGPGYGLFVDEQVRVELLATDRVELRMLYVRTRSERGTVPAARAVAVSALLRELIERTVELGALDPGDARERHIIHVVLDELDALPDAPFALAFPSDPRALRAAESLLAAEDDVPALSHIATTAGASARTLDRVFVAQTGCSMLRWVRRIRLLVGARSIAAGQSVTNAALDSGYASLSAFSSAFRREFGVSPTTAWRRAGSSCCRS